MSERNRRTRINFPVFSDYQVHMIAARDMVATGKRLRADLRDADGAFITRSDKPGMGWLVLGAHPTPAAIAHEASHAIRDLFKYTGVAEDDESFAYHLGYLVEKIHKFIGSAR